MKFSRLSSPSQCLLLSVFLVEFVVQGRFGWKNSPNSCSNSECSQHTSKDGHTAVSLPSLARSSADVRMSNELGIFSQKPDCFGRAAASVRLQCSTLDSKELDRVQLAIRLTLCEIGTAKRASIPLECKAFLLEDRYSGLLDENIQSNCVEALSRSAQSWSSYSGYLREIPQMCIALQRLNDLDAARSLYHNISIEKSMFLDLLQRRENLFLTNLDVWVNSLDELKDVSAAMSGTQQKLVDIEDNTRRNFDSIAQTTVETAISTLNQASAISRARDDAFLRDLASRLSSTVAGHERALLSTTSAVFDHYELAAQESLTAVDRQIAMAISNQEIALQHFWSSLRAELVAVQQDVTTAAGITRQMANELGETLLLAQKSQDAIAQTLVSIGSVDEAQSGVMDRMHDGLILLNQTTHDMINQLQVRPQWETSLALRIFSLATSILPLKLQYAANGMHAFKLFFFFFSAAWRLAAFGFSSVVVAMAVMSTPCRTRGRDRKRLPTPVTNDYAVSPPAPRYLQSDLSSPPTRIKHAMSLEGRVAPSWQSRSPRMSRIPPRLYRQSPL